MKFNNFKCYKIEQNYILPCSQPIVTYKSIFGFSYESSFFIQIRPKDTLLAISLLKTFAKYNKKNQYDSKICIDNFQIIMCDHVPESFFEFFEFLKKSL